VKLSVITATRNRAAFLSRCIESVASQDHSLKEHIIIDGGSTDGTVELLEQARSTHSHLQFVSEPDRGLSHAFNKGVALATGDAIGIIGDDDFYEQGALRLIASIMENDPELGIVTGACRIIRNDGSCIRIVPASFSSRRDLIKCWETWGGRVFIPAPATFIRAMALAQVGEFEERDRYAMDYRHWIKLTKYFRVEICDQVIANFREDAGSISFSSARQQWKETLAISREYWGSPFCFDYYEYLGSYLANRLMRQLRRARSVYRRFLGKR
jgi:glycosyltransferase involved in cell wall biosynthesis